MGAGDFGLEPVDALLAVERSGDSRHFRVVTIVADTHRHPPGEIDSLYLLEKAVHEVLTRLLAVGHDINPGVFLLLQHQHRRVALRLDQRLTLQLPGRPQHPRLGQPSRLRQAAGDRRLEHVISPFRLPSSLAGGFEPSVARGRLMPCVAHQDACFNAEVSPRRTLSSWVTNPGFLRRGCRAAFPAQSAESRKPPNIAPAFQPPDGTTFPQRENSICVVYSA